MTIDTLIMLSGAFVAALPFLGFPNTWDAALFLVAGIFIIALGIAVRRRVSKRERRLETEVSTEHDAPRN
ncbi:hypothetical protein A2673_00240 [Candidatus Kaiserbacteria bacterium RIFCSPHIGHO2_01_FULL_50_13]|uniref:Uncharacterized protein n=1 Tax=Candidatus Kaiserbacteria bacterium RIFCSPLOWO2_01_FULL_50_24 TaxID=1798507 RepID=A0A1F6EJ03_9BACT|nr:MAG: hypothetical protein A2673_00240 [Candidatus Kaiserbacteria bacterium RIFCSPHIGHO2_01_FULL_50_13]OGG73610.1 MAG: hypothetical protein A3A34_02960 [Candidatus Kaiserbacteria bacterium RIFCSPLOWO2_01_FULL_50_24]OGG81272.1 MAG: hypothetical protein A3H74_03820 [Candidatus Kaiserbacteria bacterium RIFCSPLOWO2_02_FULL_51_13]